MSFPLPPVSAEPPTIILTLAENTPIYHLCCLYCWARALCASNLSGSRWLSRWENGFSFQLLSYVQDECTRLRSLTDKAQTWKLRRIYQFSNISSLCFFGSSYPSQWGVQGVFSQCSSCSFELHWNIIFSFWHTIWDFLLQIFQNVHFYFLTFSKASPNLQSASIFFLLILCSPHIFTDIFRRALTLQAEF